MPSTTATRIKRELLEALRAAFVLPLEPEDLFTLSRAVDRILNYCRDLVNEAEAMGVRPGRRDRRDGRLRWSLPCGRIDEAFAALGADPDAATAAADAAISGRAAAGTRLLLRHGRACWRSRTATSGSVGASSTARCLRIGEVVVEVAERVVYAVVKQT